MATKIVTANGVYDLSNVNTLKELKEEIAFLKQTIRKDEEELENQLRILPKHFVKSTADNILPAFINKLIANGTWKLLLSSVSMFANPFAKGYSFKKNIVGSAKRLGLITLAKGAYNLWRKKSLDKKNITETIQPAISTLRTKNFTKS